jgi:MoaD family protein
VNGKRTLARIILRLFHELRDAVGSGEVQIDAGRLGDVVRWLTEEYPKLKDVLYNEKGDLRAYALYYVNNKHVNPVELDRQLVDGDVVLVVPPAAGGRQAKTTTALGSLSI